MILLLLIKILLFVLLLIFDIYLFASIIRGAPFAVTRPHIVANMVKLAQLKPGELAVDIGSGDGRLVIALARAGARAHGYEINPLLVWWSRWRIRRAGLQDNATIFRKSFWNANFTQYSVVTLFGLWHIMPRLEKKLLAELSAGARVVCNTYTFPKWKPEYNKEKILVYRQK